MTSHVSRRSFLGGLGALTLLGAAGTQLWPDSGAVAAEPSLVGGAIDVHGHALPDFWVDALRSSGIDRVSGMRIPDWSPGTAISFLDRHCIDTQIVSLPDPAVSFASTVGERVDLARRINDYFAGELIGSEQHAGRFGAFATLPLGDLSLGEQMEAAAEARRAITEAGLDGVSLLSNYGDTYLGDPKFAPLLLALNSLGAVVAVHSNATGTGPDSDLTPALLEAPFNTTRAIVNMSYLQTFTLYPNIRWLFVDAGGAPPYLAYRTSLFLIYPVIAQNLGLDIGDLNEGNFQFGNLHFDTAWSANSATMATLREIVADDHVLLGTDWPLSAPSLSEAGVVQPELPAIFGADGYEAVRGSGALALLPSVAGRTRAGECSVADPGGQPDEGEPSPVVPSPDADEPGLGGGGGVIDNPNSNVGKGGSGSSTTGVLPDTGLDDVAPLAAAGLAATLAGSTMIRYARSGNTAAQRRGRTETETTS